LQLSPELLAVFQVPTFKGKKEDIGEGKWRGEGRERRKWEGSEGGRGSTSNIREGKGRKGKMGKGESGKGDKQPVLPIKNRFRPR